MKADSDIQVFENVFLFIPVSTDWLENWLVEKFGKDYEATHGFQIIEGSKSFIALTNMEGVTGGDEHYWAEDISSTLDQPIYSLWTHDDVESNVFKWQKGEIVNSSWEDFFQFAERLGISLPGRPEPIASPQGSICLIEGVNQSDFSSEFLSKYNYLEIKQNQLGTIFYYEGKENYEIYYELMDLYPKALVYLIRMDQDNKTRIVVSKGWDDIGEMFFPFSDLYDSTLKEIKGESELVKILKVLDIPLKYFGINDEDKID